MRAIIISMACLLAATALHAQNLVYFKGDNGKYGFKDRDGNVVIPATYDGLYNGRDGRVQLGGKWGYLDLGSRTEVVAPIYDEPFYFDEGYASVCYKGKWGAIEERSYRVAVQPKYDKQFYLKKGHADVLLDGKWGYIDSLGREIAAPIYDKQLYMHAGYSAVYLDGRWGLIDSTGHVAIPAEYDVGSRFSNGLARVALNKKWGYVDTRGKLVIPARYEWTSDLIGDDRLEVMLDGETFFITREGKRIGLDRFHEAKAGTGLVAYKLPNGLIGLKDAEGEVIVHPKYDFVGEFKDGLASVKYDGVYWGLIDADGREAVRPKYTEIGGFNQYGLAEVALGDKRGYIDKSGYEVIPAEYSYLARINADGLIVAARSVSGTHRFGVLNTDGETVVPFRYDSMKPMEYGIAAVRRDGKYGYVNSNGEEIVPVIHDTEQAAFKAGNALFGND